jgi:O-antigen/teichoic acid export membrane protein
MPDIATIITSRLGRNASAKLASELVARAASFGLVLLAARQLGEVDFGRYNYALALGFVLAQLADLGLQMLVAREIAVLGRAAGPLVRAALRLKLLLSLPVLILLWLLAAGSPAPTRAAIILLGLMMLAQTYLEFAAYIFRGQQLLLVEARLLLAARLLMALLGTAVLLAGGGLALLATTNLLSVVLLALWALRLLRRDGWLAPPGEKRPETRRSQMATYRNLLRQALPLGVAIFLSIAYTRTAVLLLQMQSGETAVAMFSAAHRLVEPAQVLPASLLAAVFPAFSQALHSNTGYARRLAWGTSLLLALAGIALAAALWLGAGWLIPLLYGLSYAAAAPVLQLLALSSVPAFVNYGLTHFLIARGQQGIIGIFTAVMLVLHAFLSWQWIPRWGAAGPAAAIIVAEVVLSVACLLTLALTRPRARQLPEVESEIGPPTVPIPAADRPVQPDPSGLQPPV